MLSDQGLHSLLTESPDTTECISKQQCPCAGFEYQHFEYLFTSHGPPSMYAVFTLSIGTDMPEQTVLVLVRHWRKLPLTGVHS